MALRTAQPGPTLSVLCLIHHFLVHQQLYQRHAILTNHVAFSGITRQNRERRPNLRTGWPKMYKQCALPKGMWKAATSVKPEKWTLALPSF